MKANEIINEFETVLKGFDQCVSMIEDTPEAYSKSGVPMKLAPDLTITLFADDGECLALLVNDGQKKVIPTKTAKKIVAETYLLRDQGLEHLQAAVNAEGYKKRFDIVEGTYLIITPEGDEIVTEWVDLECA